ncbi:hypothetical protein BJX64DRAFT_289133 [Aspergillus heterothallicus]
METAPSNSRPPSPRPDAPGDGPDSAKAAIAPCTSPTCHTWPTFCASCLTLSSRIRAGIPKDLIESKKGMFPLRLSCSMTATAPEVEIWVWRHISRLRLFYPDSDPPARVHAAQRVKGSTEGGGGGGEWIDLTTPSGGMYSVQEVSMAKTVGAYVAYALPHGGETSGQEAQRRRLRKAKEPWYEKSAWTARVEREVSMLAELPLDFGGADTRVVVDMWMKGFRGGSGGDVRIPEGEAWNGLRLQWWVDTHPVTAATGDGVVGAGRVPRERSRRLQKSAGQRPSQAKTSGISKLFPFLSPATASPDPTCNPGCPGCPMGDKCRARRKGAARPLATGRRPSAGSRQAKVSSMTKLFPFGLASPASAPTSRPTSSASVSAGLRKPSSSSGWSTVNALANASSFLGLVNATSQSPRSTTCQPGCKGCPMGTECEARKKEVLAAEERNLRKYASMEEYVKKKKETGWISKFLS